MPIEDLVKLLPAKQWEALKKAYDGLGDDQKDPFLQKAFDAVRKYNESTPWWRVANWLTPFPSKDEQSKNIDPMELERRRMANRDPMVLQQELDAKNKKSYVVKPSQVFKKKAITKDVVDWYMTLDPNQYMTPAPKKNKDVVISSTQPAPYKTGPQLEKEYTDMTKKWFSWDYTKKAWNKNPSFFNQFKNQLFK